MVRQLVWTEKAQKERVEILSFLNRRNQSITYSKKLDQQIRRAFKLICKYPLLGKLTNVRNIRIRILLNYLIFYEITENEIIIVSIKDSRQNPDRIKEILLKK